jgi:tRNA1Val (adenine37-N6)-methyltransferase
MANPYFSFKQFTIRHDRCAMKVGTDGVLLGAWINVEGAVSIVDVGTGSGLIAIMIAQRCDAMIDAVEIDAGACSQARENAAACPWNKRITIYHDSIQHYTGITAPHYQIVVSNPPYFRNSLKPASTSRTQARHDTALNYGSLLRCASQLLAPEGRLAVIIPAEAITKFTEQAYFHGLHPVRQTMIRPRPDTDYSRCLAEFSGNRNHPVDNHELIIRGQDGKEFTDGYRLLTKAYYLNF